MFSNVIEVAVVMAKSRDSPLKFTTIPRLELCAAVLAARLAALAKTELRLPIHQVVFWSISTTVLSWINATTFRFHIFVSNRLGKKLETTSPDQWRYVRSALNPAGDLTHVVQASDVSATQRMFQAHLFFYKIQRPVHPRILPPNDSDPEVRDSHFLFATTR